MATGGPVIHKRLLADKRVWNRESIPRREFKDWDLYFWLVRCSIPASVPAERYAELSKKQDHITNYDGRPHGVLLLDYAATLRQQPNYNIISGMFLDTLDGIANEKEAKSKFEALVKKYFIPNGVDKSPNDRIMMILLMGLDIASHMMTQRNRVQRAFHVYQWAYEILTGPSQRNILPAKLNEWMFKYDYLINPMRKFNLIEANETLPTQTNLQPPQVSFHMKGYPLPMKGTTTPIHRPDWHIRDARVSENDPLVQPSNGDVVRSYIESRLPAGYADKIMGSCGYKKVDKQRLGVAMADYGTVLSQEKDYLAAFSRCVTLLDQSGFPAATIKDTVESHFLSNSQFILFDHIMTVIHLASDLINYYIHKSSSEKGSPKKGLLKKATEIAQGAIAKLSCETSRAGAIMKKGWGELADNKLILTRRSKFNILGNLNFIGRPAEEEYSVVVAYGGKSIDVEHQTEPIIDIIEYKQLKQLNPALLQGSQSSFCDTVFLNMAIRPPGMKPLIPKADKPTGKPGTGGYFDSGSTLAAQSSSTAGYHLHPIDNCSVPVRSKQHASGFPFPTPGGRKRKMSSSSPEQSKAPKLQDSAEYLNQLDSFADNVLDKLFDDDNADGAAAEEKNQKDPKTQEEKDLDNFLASVQQEFYGPDFGEDTDC